MGIIPFTEKIDKKKKLEFVRFWSDQDPKPDPDPHKNEVDPKHCLQRMPNSFCLFTFILIVWLRSAH